MINVFDYIFYRICDFYKKKRDSAAEISGALIVSLLQFFLIIDILVFVRIFWEYSILDNFSKYWALPLCILLAIFNWIKYVKQNKYLEYRRKWKDEVGVKRKKKGVLIVIYLIISLMIPVLYGIIRQNVMEGISFFG